MDIKDILAPGSTKSAVRGTSKKRILETLSVLAAEVAKGVDSEIALNSLICRERMGSTGIGHGIALPHGRIAGLSKPIAVAVTCSPPLNLMLSITSQWTFFSRFSFLKTKIKTTCKCYQL